ncbi:hypothetical protein AA0113_g9732 [Alternaria arborescens]|uniref:Major facilitator superfamily (MFS) profile domain-containing protein n=1 Tax=Alternaria arborescens TaxID=156630 RepID=A0A4Q4QYS4_9PLEO|nr:hypothetical protein AA0113_g9732 [Alternaria arborescens]
MMNKPTSSGQPRARLSVQWCAMLAMALDGLGCAMTKASQTFLIEQAICRAYYTEHDPSFVTPDGRVPEALCKTEELQSRVTLFAAGLDFSMLITCFLASPIYTRLASLVGARQILILNTTSFALRMAWYAAAFYLHNIIDVRWVLLSAFFDLLGGGIPMREILLYLYIAGSVPEEGMTGTFNLLSAILIGMMSLGTFIGARLLNVNVFITCALIVAVYVFLVPLVSLFPHHHGEQSQSQRTLRTYNTDDASGDEIRSLMIVDETVDEMVIAIQSDPPFMADHDGDQATKARTPTLFRALLRAATVDLYLSIELVVQTFRHPFTRRVMMLFFGTTLAAVISMTTPQWASGTFQTSLSQVDQITALEQIISACTLLALPLLSRYVLRPRLHAKHAVDLAIIVGSLLTGILSALVIAMAPSLSIYAIGVAIGATGMGLSDALRSFATSGLSSEEAVQRLYMSIRTVQTLAAIAGTPLWSGLLLWIISNPSVPRGLLYLGNCGVLITCLLSIKFLQRPS